MNTSAKASTSTSTCDKSSNSHKKNSGGSMTGHISGHSHSGSQQDKTPHHWTMPRRPSGEGPDAGDAHHHRRQHNSLVPMGFGPGGGAGSFVPPPAAAPSASAEGGGPLSAAAAAGLAGALGMGLGPGGANPSSMAGAANLPFTDAATAAAAAANTTAVLDACIRDLSRRRMAMAERAAGGSGSAGSFDAMSPPPPQQHQQQGPMGGSSGNPNQDQPPSSSGSGASAGNFGDVEGLMRNIAEQEERLRMLREQHRAMREHMSHPPQPSSIQGGGSSSSGNPFEPPAPSHHRHHQGQRDPQQPSDQAGGNIDEADEEGGLAPSQWWVCQHCHSRAFASREEAAAHEAVCLVAPLGGQPCEDQASQEQGHHRQRQQQGHVDSQPHGSQLASMAQRPFPRRGGGSEDHGHSVVSDQYGQDDVAPGYGGGLHHHHQQQQPHGGFHGQGGASDANAEAYPLQHLHQQHPQDDHQGHGGGFGVQQQQHSQDFQFSDAFAAPPAAFQESDAALARRHLERLVAAGVDVGGLGAAAAAAGGVASVHHESPASDILDAVDPVTGRRLYTVLDEPIPLAMPSDKDWITPLHCFVRRHCVQLFTATAQDVAAPSKGKRRPIQVGQVGIRCPHCFVREQRRAARRQAQQEQEQDEQDTDSDSDDEGKSNKSPASSSSRERGSVYYPTTLSSIYNATMNLLQRHLHACPCFPPEMMQRYRELKADDARSGTSKKYWIDSARSLGLVDTPCGIRFSALTPPPLPKLRREQVSAGIRSETRRNSVEFFSSRSNATLGRSSGGGAPSREGRRGSALPGGFPSSSSSSSQRRRSTLGTGSGSDSVRQLVLPEDEKLATGFSFHLLSQMQPCVFTEADRLGKRKGLPAGFAGIACRHCYGGYGAGRFFPSSIKTLSDTSKTLNVLHNHMMRCRKCPQDVRDRLTALRATHDDERSRMKFGSQKAFFARIWGRLHNGGGPSAPPSKRQRLEQQEQQGATAAATVPEGVNLRPGAPEGVNLRPGVPPSHLMQQQQQSQQSHPQHGGAAVDYSAAAGHFPPTQQQHEGQPAMLAPTGGAPFDSLAAAASASSDFGRASMPFTLQQQQQGGFPGRRGGLLPTASSRDVPKGGGASMAGTKPHALSQALVPLPMDELDRDDLPKRMRASGA